MADHITVGDDVRDDGIQHGIDDNPHGDAEKGAVGGAVGGAIVGGLAGGPVGAVIGAIAGGAASGAGVAAVDRHDNDNTVTGLGDGATPKVADTVRGDAHAVGSTVRSDAHAAGAGVANAVPGNRVPGVQTGGHDIDGTPDTRGITEKMADAVTGDRTDDKTGKPVV
ncbi:MAG: hypothetical protein M3Y13_10710 [Armatimonadota bacterium]|nr:hypothetical protein [Armatimonadota bacterium]